MGLRITGGQWRGRVIATPKHRHVRPTTSRVRESVFSRLQPYLPDARFLDGYAGSGIIGLEALSRGANQVLAVEANKPQARHLIEHRETFELAESMYTVVNSPLEKLLAKPPKDNQRYDIIYLDPPYDLVTPTWWVNLSPHLPNWVCETSLILIEAPSRNTVDWPDEAKILPYGDTELIWLACDSGNLFTESR